MKSKNVVNLVSRVLLSGIFISAGLDKVRNRERTLKYMGSKKMPESSMLLNGAIAMELGVAPAVALGVLPRFTAPLLASFLIPTAVIFHNFWKSESSDRPMERVNFLKDLAIVGGLMAVAVRDIEQARLKKMSQGEPVDAERPNYLDEFEIESSEGRLRIA